MFICEEHRELWGRDTGCPYCREHSREARIEKLEAENAKLRVYERCLPILIRGLKDANCHKALSEWDRARKLLEAKNKKPPKG